MCPVRFSNRLRCHGQTRFCAREEALEVSGCQVSYCCFLFLASQLSRPVESSLRIFVGLFRKAFSCVSGKLFKLSTRLNFMKSPESFRITTFLVESILRAFDNFYLQFSIFVIVTFLL